LSLLDLLIAAGFVLAAYLGYKSGVARKGFTLLALLIAVLASARLMRPAGGLLASAGIASGTTAMAAAFLILLCLLVVGAFFLLRWLDFRKSFKRTGQAAGLALGLVEGCLVMSVVFWGLRTFDEPGGKLRANSRLYGPVLESVPAVFQLMKPYLPGAQEFRELVGQK
jgi:uncharacterized membrane protein required for colicin V production